MDKYSCQDPTVWWMPSKVKKFIKPWSVLKQEMPTAIIYIEKIVVLLRLLWNMKNKLSDVNKIYMNIGKVNKNGS